jgi:hypothetical protein
LDGFVIKELSEMMFQRYRCDVSNFNGDTRTQIYNGVIRAQIYNGVTRAQISMVLPELKIQW